MFRKYSNKKTLIAIGIFTGLLLLFITYDLIQGFRDVIVIPEETPDEEITTENDLTTPYEEESENIPEEQTKCEYEYIIQEIIAAPEPGDDVQQIIGHQNNKVGLYIYSEAREFADLADELANSNGGDWGYVLIPYNVKDYNTDRWQHLFELLGELHLIPIIQLWDLDLDDDKRDKQIRESAEFLNSLRWPIKNRYISVYNETNDAKFWKGKVDPEGYAEVLNQTIQELKELDDDFFVMNGAFNASARTGGDYLDERAYLRRMNSRIPGIFEKLDGWASHPYPQPNFSGSPNGTGRDSIRAYDWELQILKDEFGIQELPVFITETGWAHKESEALNDGERVQYKLNEYQVADNFRYAFENVWLPDDKVVAVTPFTIRYNPPHDHFSWITQNWNKYPQFLSIESMRKVKGKPPVVSYETTKILNCE